MIAAVAWWGWLIISISGLIGLEAIGLGALAFAIWRHQKTDSPASIWFNAK